MAEKKISVSFNEQELHTLLDIKKFENRKNNINFSTSIKRNEPNNVLTEEVLELLEQHVDKSHKEQALILKEVLSLEGKMFDWFEANPENVKNFIKDPINIFKKISGSSDKLIEKLNHLPQQDYKDLGEVEISERISFDQVAKKSSSSKITDLTLGWDAIYAMQQKLLNSTLNSLYKKGIVPNNFNKTFDIKIVKCDANVEIGVSSILGGNNRLVTLKVPMDGKVTVYKNVFKKKVNLYEVSMSGYATFTMDLEVLECTIEEKDSANCELSIALNDGDLFESVDLSNLTIEPNIKDIQPVNYEEVIIALMNNVIRSISWPIKFDFEFNSPFSFDKVQARFTYTQITDDAEKNLFGILINRGNKVGTYNLLPETIQDPSQSKAAFILSNDLLMESMMNVFCGALDTDQNHFVINSDYPAILKNSKKISGKKDGLSWRFKKSGDLKSYLKNDEKLYLDAKIGLKSWYTAWMWITFSGDVKMKFEIEKGSIIANFDFNFGLPWWLWLTPVTAILKVIIDKIISDDGNLKFAIPYFYADKISSPAYIQISGNWLSAIAHAANADQEAEVLLLK